jgi:hypothetical protein
MEKEEDWTKKIIDTANHEYTIDKIAPVVIISYKRGGASTTINLLKNTKVPVYLFVYDDDYDNYKDSIIDASNVTVIQCPSKEFRGAAPKRNFVQQNMHLMGYHDYFILDDDITELFYTEKGLTKTGKYKAQKISISPEEFFTTWYFIIHNLTKERITLGGILSEFASVFVDLNNTPIYNKTGRICQIAYINADDFDKYDIKYREPNAWDDFDVELDVLNKGLHTAIIPWMTYTGDTMNPSKSVASGGTYKWTLKSMRLYQKWGNLVGFKPDKGQINSTFSWGKIKKAIKENENIPEGQPRFIPVYDENWKKYFIDTNIEPSKENPFCLDYLGFTELWKDKIVEWCIKHHFKS